MSDARLPRSVELRTKVVAGITLRLHILDDGRRVLEAEGMNALATALHTGRATAEDARIASAWVQGGDA